MVFRDVDKKALIDNAATVLSKITVIGTDIVFTENDHISEWEYEDFRYVPENGFIGQFVERLFDGRLENLPSDIDIENKEINLQLGIVNGITGETTYYDYGNFIITKIGEEDTTGVTTFESADYAKKFNKPYVDTIAYPCTTLELANSVCNQAGVELATDGYAYVYVTPKEGLEAGQYCFAKDDVYYNFTVDEDLYFYDSFMFIENKSELILKVINVDFTLTRKNIQYTESNNTVGTVLNFNKVGYCDFINNDFGIENNQFAEGGTLRDVIKAIGALAYSWVRIGTDNRVYLDFTKKDESDVNLYNVITTDDYYENDAQLETYGPVNKVVLGMSNVEGEYVSKEIVLEGVNKETSIQIWDNPFTYTEELRKVALNGSETLFGLTYTPMSINTVGHPWLEGDDYVKITNLSNQSLYTYPFDRALSYRGYIKSALSSNAKNTIQNEYEFEGDIVQAQKRTQLIVDKANQTIQLISEKVDKIEGEDYVTSAELKVATDSIQSNISATYSTKTETIEVVNQAKEDAVTEATENATAAVDEKIQDLPTQEDVENAKTEAINSANASTDEKLKKYSTTVEMNNAITQTVNASENSIKLEVNNKYTTKEETEDAKNEAIESANSTTDSKLEDYSTTSEIGALLEVKVDKDDNDQIVSMINLSSEEINLTSDRFVLDSTNAKISKEGVVDFVSGEIGGIEIGEDYLRIPITTEYDFTQEDVDKVRNSLIGLATLTDEEKIKFDVSGDGKVMSNDALIMQRIVDAGITVDKTGYFEIKRNKEKPYNSGVYIVGGNGSAIASMTLEGVYTKSLAVSEKAVFYGSLTVGGVDIANKYTTEEQVVGKTDDGKNVYQRMFKFTSLSAIPTGISDLEDVFDIRCTIHQSSGGWRTLPWLYSSNNTIGNGSWAGGFYLRDDNNTIYFQVGSDLGAIDKGSITLVYTKTTDSDI